MFSGIAACEHTDWCSWKWFWNNDKWYHWGEKCSFVSHVASYFIILCVAIGITNNCLLCTHTHTAEMSDSRSNFAFTAAVFIVILAELCPLNAVLHVATRLLLSTKDWIQLIMKNYLSDWVNWITSSPYTFSLSSSLFQCSRESACVLKSGRLGWLFWPR